MRAVLEAVLPGGGWDQRFVSCVDRARGRRGGEPGGYVDALNTLAELLVDEAVVERHDAAPSSTPLGRRALEEAEAIRTNNRGKPDVGQLLARPSLQQAFPWFADVTVLRKRRSAHPAPVGSTSPVAVGEQEAAHSEWLFRGIVGGWERSMEETLRLRR